MTTRRRRTARKTRCKGRDAKGRIKRGYRLTRGGLVRARATRRRRASTTKRKRRVSFSPFSRAERAGLGFGF